MNPVLGSPNLSNSAPIEQVTNGALPSALESINAEQLRSALAQAKTASECVEVAGLAEQIGEAELHRQALGRAVGLDRHCQTALLTLAAHASAEGDKASTFAFLEEASRAGVLPDGIRPVWEELFGQVAGEETLQNYLRAIGRLPVEKSEKPLSIVLVTNLFPPQELGGYGRMMWEFAHGLIARGHRVRVLTAEVTEFGHQAPTKEECEMEQHVMRTLKLAGTWVGGRGVMLEDRGEIMQRLRDNATRLRTAIAKCGADLVLAGNLDFLGLSIFQAAWARKIPVLHALANAVPGYAVMEQPAGVPYWVAPCSDWNGQVLRDAGYTPERIETLYPGARIDRFFRLFLPDTGQLRLCYASLVLPYKGADTLVQALGRLHAAGVDFSAEIAGDAPDSEFLQGLKALVRARGMESKVRFTGFLDRAGLAGLFARSNVLVFPSKFEEPFGISQVEALAAGLVVVSSGTGGAKEIVRDGIEGLLFTAGDEVALAGKLALLANDPALITRLQRRAQERAIRFSVDHAVAKIETLAEEMHTAVVAAETALPELNIAGAAINGVP